jgi:N-acetylglucosamine kinase-like BadF-type ATPase
LNFLPVRFTMEVYHPKEEKPMEKYYAGWDGGGSHTSVECIDESGTTLLRGKAGPLNSLGNRLDEAEKTVAEALAYMQKLPGGLRACGGLCIGGAGTSSAFMRENLQKSLLANGFTHQYRLAADFETAYFSAFGGGPGVLLAAGTGAVCYGRNEKNKSHRCGGWGHLMDDEGSGYAIGRDMLAAVVRASDGRGEPTLLTGLVYTAWGVSAISELINRIYAADTGKKEIAALTPLCFEALTRGDMAAERILLKAAAALGELLDTTVNALELGSYQLVLHGSVIRKGDFLRNELLKNRSGLSLYDCSINAAYGAAYMALARSEDKL